MGQLSGKKPVGRPKRWLADYIDKDVRILGFVF